MKYTRFALLACTALSLSACSLFADDDQIVLSKQNKGIVVRNVETAERSDASTDITPVRNNNAEMAEAPNFEAARQEAQEQQAMAEQVTTTAQTAEDEMSGRPMSLAAEQAVDTQDAMNPAMNPAQESVRPPVEEKMVEPLAAVPPKSAQQPVQRQPVQREAVQQQAIAPSPASAPSVPDLPPNAKPGECYAKVLIPAVTRFESEDVLVKPEHEELVRIIPARYEIETEQVLVKPARQFWKKGEGPIQRVDEATGEILCLVEEPAVYKTVEKRTLVEPERPEYRTVPAQYETVTREVVVEQERLAWQRILCQTNVTPRIIVKLQSALAQAGYSPGNIDGQLGTQTLDAMSKYQRDKGLASRGLTYETIESLGIEL